MKTSNHISKLKMACLALIVGIVTGLVSVGFNEVLNIGFRLMKRVYETQYFMIIIPLVASLLIAFIRHRLLTDQNQGFGVEQVMYEIELIKTQVMKPSAVIYKIIGTYLTLLAGFSAGRQGPVVHLGGAIGSNIAYQLNLKDNETRVLIGCGVAGCLAGIFNSPIFATLFVIEIIFKKRYFDMLSTILLSSIASTIVVRLFINQTYFVIFKTNYLFHMNEVINFILLGLILGLLSIFYMHCLRFFQRFFNRLKAPQVIKNLIGASVICTMFIIFSQYYFYNPTPKLMLSETFAAEHLILISLLLIVLTSITIGSGGFGGIFAPGLMIGLTFGLGLSKLFVVIGLPLLDLNTYAMAGMAAMFAGFGNAPLAAALMIVELTGQYTLLFPMLICSLISSKIAEILMQESIYHQNLDLLVKKTSADLTQS